MIDFTNAIEELNTYKGSEKKKTLILDEKKYLVKFPDPIREKNKNISYINNAFSEYVGSNIFKICGFKVQNTILGKYFYNGNDQIRPGKGPGGKSDQQMPHRPKQQQISAHINSQRCPENAKCHCQYFSDPLFHPAPPA